MSKLFDSSKTKTQTTLNGATTHRSSLNKNVDLFFKIGSLRNNPDVVSEDMFWQAYDEDAEMAVRILLYSRDIRGGMGEREIFRRTFRNIAIQNPSLALRVLHKVPELGRWDDVLVAIGTPIEKEAVEFVQQGLTDKSTAGLCAKWMPRMRGNNTEHNKEVAKTLAKGMKLSYQEYNKLVSSLSSTVEQKISKGDFTDIDYSKIPSLAAARYQRLFNRKDTARYQAYKDALVKGVEGVKVNAGAVFPYDVVKSARRGDSTVSTAQWKALPDYMNGSKESVLCVVDVSGSMGVRVAGETSAMDIAVSLGLYTSERSRGIFRNKMITFSETPSFIEVSDSMTLRQKIAHVERSPWGMSTNLQSVFDMILTLAVRDNLAEEDLPTRILIVSDMEFNYCCRGVTNFEAIKAKYARAGYNMPQLVFWNVTSRQQGNIPVQVTDSGVALVSGFSPAVLQGVLSGEMNPVSVVEKLVCVERYDF
jgi:hypothetical protein|nr:MAG TPA: protein of unknown function (DUF2828) [Caudoviricetes sp.]